ncbi:MBL fold metallo-hydrolase [Candidatus Bathyarchaeota archaeon]|nr:MBL fold metallo-hydrolase [Candidatus Bathyarchaeota archaeon]
MEIADGIHLIKNPHSTYFVSSVLIMGESLTLVDAGRVESPETSIYPAIKALGRDPREISLLVLTHAHWDHCAGAAQIKRETGCDVAVHSNGKAYLADPETVAKELTLRFPGVPAGNMAAFDAVDPEIVFSEGSTIALDGRELKVVHTPGHSAGSCCIVEADLGLYIAGDSIQGRGERRPLIFHDANAYLSSMNRLLGEPIEILVNGHPFPPSGEGVLRGEVTKRHVEESIKAVEELKDTVLEALGDSDGAVSLVEIHEAIGAFQPFTIGCILEALKAEGKATRETAGGRVLWQA